METLHMKNTDAAAKTSLATSISLVFVVQQGNNYQIIAVDWLKRSSGKKKWVTQGRYFIKVPLFVLAPFLLSKSTDNQISFNAQIG